MAVFKFIALAAASLALVRADDAKPTAKDANSCVDAMNLARREVGLADLTKDSAHSNISTGEYSADTEGKIRLTTLCKILQQEQDVEDSDFEDKYKAAGAFGYHKQNGTSEDCEAAVTYWKGGYTKFNHTLPPAPEYTSSPTLGAAPYDTPQATGFVALFNPEDNAKGQCVFLTCPGATQPSARSETSTAAPGPKALVCITNPNPFKGGKAPFTEDQWKQITDVFNPNSANVAAPTFVALAAAALGLAFF